MVINSGLVHRITDLLSKERMSIVLAIMRVTGRIVLGSFEQVDIIINQQGLLDILI